MTSYGSNSFSAFSEDSAVSYVSISISRVERVQLILRRRQLRAADVGGAVQNLALQIADIDDVEIDDAEGADARGGEIQRGGRT